MSDVGPQDKPGAEGLEDEVEEIVGAEDAEGHDDAAEQHDDEADLIDDQGEEDAGQAREVARQPSRGQRQFGAVREENRELRTRIADFERQLAQISQAQRQPSPAELAAAERAEAEAVSMMAPAEVAKYYAQKSEQRVSAELNQTRQLLWDQNDQAQFETLLTQNPNFGRYKEKVEEFRRQAPGVARRILLATAIGMQAMDGAPAAKTRARNRAAAAAERQSVRPPSNGRGDVATEGRGGSRWDRLKDVQI